MINRLSEINEIINKVHISENKDNEIVKKIKDKFIGTFDEYAFVGSAEKINKGDIIRYVDLGLTKVSIAGIVIDIIYEKNILSQSLKYFVLINKYTHTYWKIVPKSVYIFRSYKLGKLSKRHTEKLINGIKSDDAFWKNIDDYKERFDKGLLE